MAKLSQADCKTLFIETLRELDAKLAVIDAETPYSTREPEWWLALNNLRKSVASDLKKFDSQS